MKKLNKVLVLVLAVIMTLAMSASVFAQTVPATTPDDDNATITINNPANGETYSVFKLFDATVTTDGKIAYQTTEAIPDVLANYFTKSGNDVFPADSICQKDSSGKVVGTIMTDELKEALETWAKNATASATAKSNGEATLEFTNLPYGYYVMTTTHKDQKEGKALITVTSTKPNAVIYDKNANKPSAKEKKVYDAEGNPIESASIGDTVTYVAKFDTTNFLENGTGTNGNGSKKVTAYEISDTLPEFMTDVTIKSVTVGGKALTTTPTFTDKKFKIDWVDANGNSLYAQGAEIVVTYTAKITSTVNINTVNKNTISIQPYVNGQPYEDPYSVSEELKTYAAALKKVDEEEKPLPGAQFTIKGLTVTGSNGVYTVVSYDPSSNTESAVLDTDENGMLYIVGLASDAKLTVTEYKAPEGYNKADIQGTLDPQVLSTAIYKEAGTYYYDEDGNLTKTETQTSVVKTENNLSMLDANAFEVVNKKGVELPSTGGIGTTIFYILGSLLVIGCGIVLISRKRMENNK